MDPEDGPNDVVRHAELLAGAFAEGVDLGPRSAQIRALGRSLRDSLALLRHACAAFEASPESQDPENAARVAEWHALIGRLETLVELARRYESPDG